MEHQRHNKNTHDYDPKDLKWNFEAMDKGRESQFWNDHFNEGIEFKSESWEIWSKTGNIFIEAYQLNKTRESGIYVTKAKLWIHGLYGENGDLIQALYIPIDILWDCIFESGSRLKRSNHETTTNNVTHGFIVPIKLIIKKLNPLLDS